MKKRYEEWLKLTGSDSPASEKIEQASPLQIRRLPGFQQIEDKLLLYSSVRGTLPPDVEKAVDDLSLNTFGITATQTEFAFPEHYQALPVYSDELREIEDAYYEFEDRFDTSDATDDEAVEILLGLGLDFRDERGFPLRSTKLFMRQAEAAAKEIAGCLPSRGDVEVAQWKTTLEQEAYLYMRRKRAG
ncbi:hypothetical protein [Aminobacter aminovorans]|uniref:hypothetical protein n=1 Tax=Aminobacter aminovorans TaxID=83263 RepID=UPI00286526F5|nr:hypothetical protein [Aminobacter aminovorans]MDR7224365.1 hypothetical protein [Aminobacter aminovorans]